MWKYVDDTTTSEVTTKGEKSNAQAMVDKVIHWSMVNRVKFYIPALQEANIQTIVDYSGHVCHKVFNSIHLLMIAKINFLNCFQLQITFRTNYGKLNVLKFQNGKLIVVGTLLSWQISLSHAMRPGLQSAIFGWQNY